MRAYPVFCYIFLAFTVASQSDPIVDLKNGLVNPCAQGLANIPPRSTELGLTPNIDALQAKAVVLSSKDLTLRTPSRNDLAAIVPIFNDFLTVRYTWFLRAAEDPWSLDLVREKFESSAALQLAGQQIDFVLKLKDDSETVIGRCALFPGKGAGKWEFGITIYRDHWGNHYAEQVMREVVQYAFTQMNAKEVWFRTEHENTRMLRQYERMGIPKVIDVKDDVPEAPLFHRYHHFAISSTLWEQHKKTAP